MMRSADTLDAGQVELGGGVAVSTLPETVPVAHGHVGVTDRLELGAQYEVYSGFAEARFGVLKSKDDGLGLALGLGGGFASALFVTAATGVASVTVGRRFGMFDLYLGDRLYYLPGLGKTRNTTKLGGRVTFSDRFILGLEAGGTLHDALLFIGEATGHAGVVF